MTRGEWVRYMDIRLEDNPVTRQLRVTLDRHQPSAVVERRDMYITDQCIAYMDEMQALVIACRAAQVAAEAARKEIERLDRQVERYRQSDRDWRWRDWVNSWRMLGLAYAVDTRDYGP